jgi:membrane protein YdbS with pleckstrin-like domain
MYQWESFDRVFNAFEVVVSNLNPHITIHLIEREEAEGLRAHILVDEGVSSEDQLGVQVRI